MSTYKNKKVVINGKTYLLGESVGSGGNGYVCSARVEDDLVEYAIKFLTVRAEDDNYKLKKERFENELNFCEKASHPNIIKVYGHGEFDGRLCYVMERHPKTLKKVIEEEVDMFQLLKYLEQLCEAVKYIHKKGIIHRDIKPENVFLNNNGQLVLADFGIAHFVDSTLTLSGDWLGNKSYAAPEQLAKGYATDITPACDIFSLGMIINELFTKVKPSGSKYTMISEVEPMLYSLDDLVYRCMLQNPAERPEIDEVLAEITLIRGDIQQDADTFLDNVLVDELLPEEVVNNILNKACRDVLAAKYIFQRTSEEELDRYDCNYHRDIRYNVSEYVKALYFQKLVYEMCLHKFKYESNVYSSGSQYSPLNLENQTENELYKKFENIILKRQIQRSENDLTGQILKLFSSCCDYHCEELLSEVSDIEKLVVALDDSPILYVVYKLRKTFDIEILNEIDLVEHINVNWTTTVCDEFEKGSLYRESDSEEQYILEKMQEDWGIIWRRIDSKHFSIKFRDKDSYRRFRRNALEIAKPYHVFEGDVLTLIRIRREFNGIIELEPWNSFDVLNAVAKILGMRDDF